MDNYSFSEFGKVLLPCPLLNPCLMSGRQCSMQFSSILQKLPIHITIDCCHFFSNCLLQFNLCAEFVSIIHMVSNSSNKKFVSADIRWFWGHWISPKRKMYKIKTIMFSQFWTLLSDAFLCTYIYLK